MTDTLAPAPAAKPLVLRTSIGKKVAMAASGIVLVGFVIAHMIGNLKFFTGETHFDEYAHFLRTVGEPVIPYHWLLWGLRGVLLVAVPKSWLPLMRDTAVKTGSGKIPKPTRAPVANGLLYVPA